MTSPLYPILNKILDDEWIRLERNQITPWVFMKTQKPFTCKDFYGKVISYEGIGFEGSPRNVFWGRYIEPFLEDITERAVLKTVELAIEKRQKANEPLAEVADLLKSVARRAYDNMAVIDQRLLGNGFPENVPRKDVSEEFSTMENFIDQRVSAELAMTKRKCWPLIKSVINNQWIVAIGAGLILLYWGIYLVGNK